MSTPQQILDSFSRGEIDSHEAVCQLREYYYPADGPRPPRRTMVLSGSRINGETRGWRPATGA